MIQRRTRHLKTAPWGLLFRAVLAGFLEWWEHGRHPLEFLLELPVSFIGWFGNVKLWLFQDRKDRESMFEKRTIVALATPPGEGGLAVVRLSGPASLLVAERVFSGLGNGDSVDSHRVVYGILNSVLVEKEGSYTRGPAIDEVLALPMLAPRSYTGEDTVEFFCHGSRLIVGMVVKACRMAGAFPATAGEFSQQAFLNGRISLDQAEAVADLIHADNEYAARAALKQLRGGLNSELKDIEQPLLQLLSQLEGSLEFTEEEDVSVSLTEVSSILSTSIKQMDKLLALVPAGRLLREGVQVVLAGPPNVGKSSLFNALLDEQRAIVDPEAGTTRDVISGRVSRGSRLFVFHDTAGLRENAGRVEKIGIERTHSSIRNADIVLQLREAGSSSAALEALDDSSELITLDVVTKYDLCSEEEDNRNLVDCVCTSSISGAGIEDLWEALENAVSEFGLEQAVGMGIILNERHKHKIQSCRQDLFELDNETKKMIAMDFEQGGEEIVATLLSSVLSSLGEISGRVFSEQLLESVFKRFCVGK